VANKGIARYRTMVMGFLFFFTLVAILKILVGATDLFASFKATDYTRIGGFKKKLICS
jgi:hypothetical protein